MLLTQLFRFHFVLDMSECRVGRILFACPILVWVLSLVCSFSILGRLWAIV